MARIRFDNNTPMFQESGQIDGSGDLVLEINTFDGKLAAWFQTHWFYGFDFYSDEELQIPVDATSGTVVVTIQRSTNNSFSDIPDGSLQADADLRGDAFAANVDTVRFTFAGVDADLYARVRVIGNTN